MNILIRDKKRELEALCIKYGVRQLEIFGSAATGDFDSKSSDIDFLVEFNDAGLKYYADCYFGLLEALELLFSYPIELVILSSVKNPYFLKSIEKDRELLCAA